jgi:hypothetical protein
MSEERGIDTSDSALVGMTELRLASVVTRLSNVKLSLREMPEAYEILQDLSQLLQIIRGASIRKAENFINRNNKSV